MVFEFLLSSTGCAVEPSESVALDASASSKTTVGEICDGEDNDADAMVDEDCDQCDLVVTRARMWWRMRMCVVDGSATGFPLVPVTVGSTINLTSGSETAAYLATNPVGVVAQLGQQIVVARLNAAAFFLDDLPYDDIDASGDNETVGEIIAAAESAYTSGTAMQRASLRMLLNTFNNDGASFGLWFDPTCVNDPEVCDGLDNDGDGSTDENCACDPDAYSYDFGADIQPILDSSCIGCHTDYPQYGYYAPWGLDLNFDVSYGNLVNVAAGGLPTMDRVEPGDSANSYVVHKLRGTHLDVGGQGDQMPQYGPYLDEATIGMIETWIDEGAPNN